MIGVVSNQKKGRNVYYSKYQQTYGNRSYVIPRDDLKDTIICRKYSGRKRNATCFVYLKS